ncbi:hypothetical protein [Kitasatospora sp. NPDC094015]|uniref:hypothetical protein n=1 Tax=Kitasatospora sp. NPDC094015 TaxID=3155205 RepID=UPI00332DFB9A
MTSTQETTRARRRSGCGVAAGAVLLATVAWVVEAWVAAVPAPCEPQDHEFTPDPWAFVLVLLPWPVLLVALLWTGRWVGRRYRNPWATATTLLVVTVALTVPLTGAEHRLHSAQRDRAAAACP